MLKQLHRLIFRDKYDTLHAIEIARKYLEQKCNNTSYLMLVLCCYTVLSCYLYSIIFFKS